MSPSLSDTHFLIILQHSLLPLKTHIKYEWVFSPFTVLTRLSWAPASPIISFYDIKLPSIRSHLICSLPGHPVWRGCVPLVVAVAPVGRGMALSNSLIKAVIRPNPGHQNELLSEPGVPDSSGGRIFLIYSLTGSFSIYILMGYCVLHDIVDIISNGWSVIPNKRMLRQRIFFIFYIEQKMHHNDKNSQQAPRFVLEMMHHIQTAE